MKLQSLNFKGFGPYLQEQSVIFPTARKVAILGTNGAGKTFLLDTVPAALFKTVPNRSGGFYENFSGSDAYIDLRFSLGVDNYRVKRLINANSRTQKAYIWKNGEALNDGKDSAFSAEIQKLGLNESAFMAALYQSQNGAGSVLNMDVNSRIKLLAIILNLMKFEEDHAKVVEAHKSLTREIDDLRLRRDQLAQQMPNREALNQQLAQAQVELSVLEAEAASLEQRTQDAIQRVANAQANAQGLDDLRREIANLEAEIAADNKEKAELLERVRNNQELVINRRDEILQAAATIESEQKIIKIGYSNLQELQKSLKSGQEAIEKWNLKIREKVEVINQRLSEQRAKLLSVEGQLRDAQMSKAKLNTVKVTAEGKIVSLKPSTEIIERVPCVGMEINNSCELLKNAHANVQQIAKLILEIADTEKAIAEADTAIQQLEIKVEVEKKDLNIIQDDLNNFMSKKLPAEMTEAITAVEQCIKETNGKIEAANKAITIAEPLAKMTDKLEGAEERVKDYNARLAVLDDKIQVNSEALETKRAKVAEASNVEATIRAAEQEKQSLSASKVMNEQKQKILTQSFGSINSSLELADKLESDVKKLDAEIAEYAGSLAEVALLREGLGPKGAKNLKIDAAGKAITERANRLIRIGLGPQFSIIINTLKELQSKDENGDPEVRETLELKIINNDSGEEMLIENLSGGEKAMAGLVFSLSLAVEQREASGLDIRTLILDEPSAGLSEENSVKYLDMLDAVLDETGIEQVFFISHMPTMQSLADGSIYVHKSEGASSRVEVRS